MQEILDNSYPYELVDVKPEHYKYDFVSVGIKEIPKRVSIRPIWQEYYNLGFGNIKINDNGEEEIDDTAKNDNKTDGDKILCTALSCSLDFLIRNDGTKIAFFGNTALKHRLYKMRLCGKLESLKQSLVLKGAIINDYTIKLDANGYKVLGQIDPNKIQYEDFDVTNCNHYNFITFEIIK